MIKRKIPFCKKVSSRRKEVSDHRKLSCFLKKKNFLLRFNTCAMAKEKEKKQAYIFYVEMGKNARETSELTGISEVTLSKWVNEGKWKEARASFIARPKVRGENISQIINGLAERRIELSQNLRELECEGSSDEAEKIRTEIARIDDSVSKWNKTLMSIEKDGRISMSVYLDVMERIFNSLRGYNEKLYMNTLEFQEYHVHDISQTL